MFNNFLHWVEARGLNSPLYDTIWLAGTVAVFLYFLCNRKNYRVSFGKAVAFLAVVYTASVLWMFFLYWVVNGFRGWGGNNIVRIFPWVAVFAYPVSKLLKLDFEKMCDYIAPVLCLQHGVSHLGCIFGGCCYGYAWSHGAYNHVLGYNTFPIQPIEAVVALAIVIIIVCRERKKKYMPDGLSYPVMLMLFGYTRFLLEFARDNGKLFLGISELALHALLAALVGTVWYIVKKKEVTQ